MRWEDLFADLEARFDAEIAGQDAAAVSDVARSARASVPLADRVRASLGHPVELLVADGEWVRGTVLDSGAEWVLLADLHRRLVVATAHVGAIRGLAARVDPGTTVQRRLGLGHVVRGLSRDRATVRLRTASTSLVGRIDRVGADHLDLATDRRGEKLVTVPLAAVVTLASDEASAGLGRG